MTPPAASAETVAPARLLLTQIGISPTDLVTGICRDRSNPSHTGVAERAEQIQLAICIDGSLRIAGVRQITGTCDGLDPPCTDDGGMTTASPAVGRMCGLCRYGCVACP